MHHLTTLVQLSIGQQDPFHQFCIHYSFFLPLISLTVCRCFELPPTSKFVLLRVWLGWCAQRTRRLYWFRQKVPTSSSSLLLVLLAPKVCSRGYKRAREGKDPKSLVKGVSGCWELDRFPFYRTRKSMGYNRGKGEERERGKLPESSGLSSHSCWSHGFCRCQHGQLHVAALSVTSAMRGHRLSVMAFHPVPTDIVVN